MKKISIITYHFVPNYGAVLQAWGVQKALRKLGYEVEFIDYRPSHLTSGGFFKLPVSKKSLKANLVIAYQKYIYLKRFVLGDGGKEKKFDAFISRYLNLGENRYFSNRKLNQQPPEAGVFICGSDQIWNSSVQYGIDSSYFFDFVRSGKKISYAASFGRPFVDEEYREEVSQLISSFDAVSVREKSAVEIVKDLAGKDAICVPDPTLLVEDGYPEAIRPDFDGDYVFSYTLRSRELVESIEETLSEHFECDVVSPITLSIDKKGAPGPLEWLGFIKHAKFIVTNSYHGTLFSIIFRKPFVFVGLTGKKSAFNERAKSLLGRLGLTDRMVFEENGDRLQQLISEDINWDIVHSGISTWRDEAFQFLRDSIEG